MWWHELDWVPILNVRSDAVPVTVVLLHFMKRRKSQQLLSQEELNLLIPVHIGRRKKYLVVEVCAAFTPGDETLEATNSALDAYGVLLNPIGNDSFIDMNYNHMQDMDIVCLDVETVDLSGCFCKQK